MNLTAVFIPAEEGGYTAFVEEIPGAITQGETMEEARENLMDALRKSLDTIGSPTAATPKKRPRVITADPTAARKRARA